ncbi:Hypothetical predicted protein [Mytilus galloprovincialis]|uniref:Peptidase M12A domain-containing protein n=1 Tax=Mytilus galloprovincialis TaxID=29158 RepID=A0A8B6FGE6_MYTGA|nr:Hypothetical predicted protein [Mytilus galloprovincialis]
MDLFSRTTNSKKMRNDLNSNRSLWGHQSSPDAIRLSQVHGLLEAIEKRDYTEILKLYYRSQHQHTLNPKKKPLDIHVYIHRNQLDIKWIPHVEYAIKAIDGVTPGVNLFETIERDKSMIRIGVDDLKEQTMACTIHGSVLDLIKDPSRAKPFIHLGGKWREDQMKGTSIHELMHALSFHHEMQRFDTDLYLDVDENLDHNFCKKTDYALTRFDPFSVMMYPESIHLKRKEDGDRIWEMKETRERCQELSELNKVALNLIYKPCVNKFKNYSPKLSIQTQMLYCGRKVMITHNQVGESTTDGNCGPNNWANCPACRVITRIKDDENKSTEIPKLTKCLGKGKWQGLSGLFYCGKKDLKLGKDLKYMKSDGICGPDTGVPCDNCGQELFKYYSIASCDNIFKPRN